MLSRSRACDALVSPAAALMYPLGGGSPATVLTVQPAALEHTKHRAQRLEKSTTAGARNMHSSEVCMSCIAVTACGCGLFAIVAAGRGNTRGHQATATARQVRKVRGSPSGRSSVR